MLGGWVCPYHHFYFVRIACVNHSLRGTLVELLGARPYRIAFCDYLAVVFLNSRDFLR